MGFKIPTGHVERVMKNVFSGDGTKSARENMSLEEEVCEEDDKSLSLGMPM